MGDPFDPGIQATGWLVLQCTRFVGGKARDIKLSRVTQNPPHLDGHEVSVKLTVQVPRAVFDKGLAAVTIEVPEELIAEPTVDVKAV